MAVHVSDAQVAALPVQDYATLRPTLLTGDLLFCSGEYTISKLIEKATNSPWSHVGIIYCDQTIQRVLLLESVEDFGVRLAPLSKYLSDYENGKAYKGALVLARRIPLTDANANAIMQFGVDQLTAPYDNGEIAELVWRIGFGIGRNAGTRGYICSELVAACFEEAGIPITPGAGGFTTPEDVWVDPKVSLLGRVQGGVH